MTAHQQRSCIPLESWNDIANVDAREILKQNVETVHDIPHQFRSQFRMAAETLQSAREFEDPIIQKGAETAIALLLTMLLRAPNLIE